MDVQLKCKHCGLSSNWPIPISFRAECPSCVTELHSCRHCLFFAPGRNNDCSETQAERVADNERNNHCEWFAPASGSDQEESSKPDPLAAAEALFKKT